MSTSSEVIGMVSGAEVISVAPEKSRSFSESMFNQLSGNPLFSAGAGLAGLVLTHGCLILSIGTATDQQEPCLVAESGRAAVSVEALPGHGNHYFSYKYRWIHCERTRQEQTISIDGRRTPFETVTLTTLGTDPRFLLQIVHDAANDALSKLDTGLVVYKAIGAEWRRAGIPRPKRKLESVVLADDSASRIVADIEEFVGSRKWYEERGIPYRRGYLFYGPPGTGKSSFITCLASHLGYSVCIMSLSDRLLDDDRLNYLLNSPPANSIIILEDIDAAVTNRDDPKNHDQIYQGMTRLDKALIRPGRVDIKEYFGNATQEMIRKMFLRFYGDNCTDEDAANFAHAAISLGIEISPATLQGHFLLYKKEPRIAIAQIDDLLKPLHLH